MWKGTILWRDDRVEPVPTIDASTDLITLGLRLVMYSCIVSVVRRMNVPFYERLVAVFKLSFRRVDLPVVVTCSPIFSPISSLMNFKSKRARLPLFRWSSFFARRKNKSDPRLSARSLLKLRACSEQAKHVLSTTPVTQCSIDALYDGLDLDCNISRFVSRRSPFEH